jgi:cytochrome c
VWLDSEWVPADREWKPMSWWVVLCLLLFAGAASPVRAQLPPRNPKPAPMTAAGLFASQCGICHAAERDATPRQGPNLFGVFLRKAGALPGFHYSPGFAQADFVWDDESLDAWLTDPQKLIPGTAMKYRQADPAVRSRIIAWLKELH